MSATLLTNKFKTRHGIHVGLSKKDVIQILKEFGLKSVPRVLVLEDSEIYELLTFSFKGDILSKIEFEGYVD